MRLEELDVFEPRTWIRITELDPNTPRNIAAKLPEVTEETVRKRLGARNVGSCGRVTRALLCFGSNANEVAYVDPDGKRNGEMGIIFPGEAEKIPDLHIAE